LVVEVGLRDPAVEDDGGDGNRAEERTTDRGVFENI
jgi:hypothetical protein